MLFQVSSQLSASLRGHLFLTRSQLQGARRGTALPTATQVAPCAFRTLRVSAFGREKGEKTRTCE